MEAVSRPGSAHTSPRVSTDPRRLLLAGAGVLAVGLAALGVVVPGLPTTVFLIAASYCFARSCPWLEERLLRNRLFAPYLRAVEGREPMPRRARLVALATMWGSVGVSLWVLDVAGRLPAWLAAVIVVAAIAGTVAIARVSVRPRVKPGRLEVCPDRGEESGGLLGRAPRQHP